MNQAMTFVLVPGGWHGAWCFKYLTRALRSAGHTVFPITLTGVGERAHLADPSIDLDTHIADVVGVLDAEELSDAVLLGHSLGGCVITGVADRRPNLISALIYLDAIVPKDGESMMDHVSEAFRVGLVSGAQAKGQGYLVPIPPMDFLSVPPEHAEWMTRRLTPHPLGVATQAIRLTSQQTVATKIYIDCDSPSIEPTHLTKQRLKDASDWNYLTIHTGHDPFIDHPTELSELILRALK
jgi:pimeloyl-ACP methyl ester carboxylesterase